MQKYKVNKDRQETIKSRIIKIELINDKGNMKIAELSDIKEITLQKIKQIIALELPGWRILAVWQEIQQ